MTTPNERAVKAFIDRWGPDEGISVTRDRERDAMRRDLAAFAAEAVRAEREACCRVLCISCDTNSPVSYVTWGDGKYYWWHRSENQECSAAKLRARTPAAGEEGT